MPDLPLVRMLWSLVTGGMVTGAVEEVRHVPLAATCGAGAAVLGELAATVGGDEAAGAAVPGSLPTGAPALVAQALWAAAPGAASPVVAPPAALLATAWDGASTGAATPE
jgi:hypothetical protein